MAPAGPVSAGAASPTGPPLAPDAWSAVLDDGRQISVAGVVLLGRNPQPRPGEEDAQLIKVDDPGRTVSKSHLELGVNAGGMYVLDRGSTNGSTVTNANGLSKRCSPGDVVMVSEGNIVSFGDHWLEVRRG
jgi:pSer/pThr/pTyr-binding forkhead associated (FHA) protein